MAKRFRVSPGVVQRLLNLKRTKTNLAPLKPSGGKPSQLEGYKAQVIEMVAQYPDYTLEEYCEYCEEITGVRLSASAMCRFLQKQNLSVKKNIQKYSSTDRRKTTSQTLDHPLKGKDFRAFIQEKLLPKLWTGAVVVMDNLSAHKVSGIEELINSFGASIVYLSPYFSRV